MLPAAAAAVAAAPAGGSMIVPLFNSPLGARDAPKLCLKKPLARRPGVAFGCPSTLAFCALALAHAAVTAFRSLLSEPALYALRNMTSPPRVALSRPPAATPKLTPEAPPKPTPTVPDVPALWQPAPVQLPDTVPR